MGDGFDDLAVTNVYTDANLNQPGAEPEFRLPSRATILFVDHFSRNIVITQDTVTRVDFAFPGANPEILVDVSGDLRVTARDALLVINEMARLRAAEGESSGTPGRARTDVNGDGRTSALDALIVVNHLRRYRDLLGDLADDDDEDDREQRTAAVDVVLASNLV